MRRLASSFKWIAIGMIGLGLVLAACRLPAGALITALSGRLGRLGVWGPVVFGLIYIVAVIVLVPASTLTLAAGALFGLVVGTIIASLASTTGAALAFLIARWFGRAVVADWLQRHPKLQAIDRAIAAGGWKVVALLRLSPVIPFNVQNYCYGLTSTRFWPCVLTSWLAMLPGTVLYVSLGTLGRAGFEAAAGRHTRTPAQWTMLLVGLLATVAVSWSITRWACRTLRDRVQSLNGEGDTP
jgi:uncharacterized membrane protein YdjX (TVP38/TMEM64 family)